MNVEHRTLNIDDATLYLILEAVLKAAGASLKDVVKVSVFLQNPKDFKPMNEVYATYFKDHKPARTTVPGVEGTPGILIEIDVIAATQ